MIRCLAIDDEPLALDIIESYIRKVPYLQLVRKCSSPLEAIPVLNAERIDLLFIDIQMPEINGIEFLKTIRTDSMVIFTTAHSGYALESYDLNCVDYLLKPISFERFLKAVNKAYEKFGKPLREPAPGPAEGKARTGYLFLKDGHKLVKVLVKDITYIEGLKDYVIVHTAGKRITILQSMKSIEEILSEKSFIRVHKSFIVSLEKIDAVEGNTIRIGNSSIPVGETYKAAFVEALRKNIL